MLRELSSSLREAQAGWTVGDGLGATPVSPQPASKEETDNGSSDGIRTESRHLGLQESGIQRGFRNE